MITIGIVSGYFNPVHAGHIDYIKDSKNQCDYLITIVNNDKQVEVKKSFPFMNENHRCKIMSNLKFVNEVVLSIDEDGTVCKTLQKLYNRYNDDDDFKLKFFNSGDRVNNYDSKEKKLCEELNIQYVIIDSPKIHSSSKLIENILNNK